MAHNWANELFPDSFETPTNYHDPTSIDVPFAQTTSHFIFSEQDSLASELSGAWGNEQNEESSTILQLEDNEKADISVTVDIPPTDYQQERDSKAILSDEPEEEIDLSEIPVKSSPPPVIKEESNFEIYVMNPEVQGEGVSAYVTYTVETKTKLDIYSKKEMSVKRRFSDFIWLQEQLILNHKGIIIPPVPEKSVLQTNKFSGNAFSQNLLEFRRFELEKFLQRVASHPILSISKYLQLFLETQDNSKFTSAKVEDKPKTGFFSSIISKAVGNTPGTEIDLWFADKSAYISNLKQRLEFLITTAQLLNQNLYDSLNIQSNFMEALKSMGNCESSNTTLARTFYRVSEIMAQKQLYEHELAENSGKLFVDVLADYGRMMESVQRVIDWRLLKLGDYQFAAKDLDNKQQRLAGKPEDSKLKTQLVTAQQRVEETKQIFENASELVRSELERFDALKAQEIHFAIVQFAQFNLNREISVMCPLENDEDVRIIYYFQAKWIDAEKTVKNQLCSWRVSDVEVQSRVICVDACSGTDVIGCGSTGSCCRSLNYTLSLANPRDQIELQPGKYTNFPSPYFVILVDDLTILANAPNTNTTQFMVQAKNFTLIGVSIIGTSFTIAQPVMIVEPSNNTKFVNCSILANAILNDYAVGNTSGGTLEIDGCTFANNTYYFQPFLIPRGLIISGNLVINNTSFANSSPDVNHIIYGGNVTVSNSLFDVEFIGEIVTGFPKPLIFASESVRVDSSIFFYSVANTTNFPIYVAGQILTSASITLVGCSIYMKPESEIYNAPLFLGSQFIMDQCIFENTSLMSPIFNFYLESVKVNVTNCIFQNLQYQNQHFPLFLVNSNTFNLLNTTFTNVTSTQPLAYGNATTITDCTFIGNHLVESMITIANGTVINTVFQANTISDGSALDISGTTPLNVSNSYFDSNVVSGGAIRHQLSICTCNTACLQTSSPPLSSTIKNCTFTNNHSDRLASAIYNIAGTVNVNNCTFINNSGVTGYKGAISTSSYHANCSDYVGYTNITDGTAILFVSGDNYFQNNTLMESSGVLTCPRMPNGVCNGTILAGIIELLISPYDYCGNLVDPYEDSTTLFSVDIYSQAATDYCKYEKNTDNAAFTTIGCPDNQIISEIIYADWGTFTSGNVSTCAFVYGDCQNNVTSAFSYCIGSNSCNCPYAAFNEYPRCSSVMSLYVQYTCYPQELFDSTLDPWYKIGSYFARNLSAYYVGELAFSVLFDQNILLENGNALFTLIVGSPSVNRTVCAGNGFSGSAYINDYGTEVSFEVGFYDANNNHIRDSSIVFAVQVIFEGQEVPTTVGYNYLDGNFIVSYPVANTGVYDVTVWLDDEIAGSGSFYALTTPGVWISVDATETSCSYNNHGNPCRLSSLPNFLYNLGAYDAVNIFCLDGIYEIGDLPRFNVSVAFQPDPHSVDVRFRHVFDSKNR